MLGVVWPWGRGIKWQKLSLIILLTALLPISCNTSAKKSSEASELNDEDMSDDGNDVMDPEFPHPAQVSASSTKQLLITHEQPNAQSLDACRANLQSTANSVFSVPALSDATEKFNSLITESPSLYHWCFYQMLSQLDEKLAGPDLELTKKYQTFVSEIKFLFILAQALDTNVSPPIYCQYLKLRYIDISKMYFGRRLSVVQNAGCGLTSDNQLSSN